MWQQGHRFLGVWDPHRQHLQVVVIFPGGQKTQLGPLSILCTIGRAGAAFFWALYLHLEPQGSWWTPFSCHGGRKGPYLPERRSRYTDGL